MPEKKPSVSFKTAKWKITWIMVQEKLVIILQDRVRKFKLIWELWADYVHTPLLITTHTDTLQSPRRLHNLLSSRPPLSFHLPSHFFLLFSLFHLTQLIHLSSTLLHLNMDYPICLHICGLHICGPRRELRTPSSAFPNPAGNQTLLRVYLNACSLYPSH